MYKYAYVVIAILFVICFWGLVLSLMPTKSEIKYDCTISEISPDFPIEVKEQCRKLRSGRI